MTPDIKEKLVELICDALDDGCGRHCKYMPCARVRNVIDALISNGVTIQEWIPVEERLPKSEGSYLVYRKDAMGQMYVDITGYYYGDLWTHIWRNEVTHWMPLPEPPKGE